MQAENQCRCNTTKTCTEKISFSIFENCNCECQLCFMKNIILLLLIMLSIESFGQQVDKPSYKELGQEYLAKSKKQKTTGNILAMGGAVIFTAETIIWASGFSKGWGDSNSSGSGDAATNTGTALMVSGLAAFAAGIPFAIDAKRNEKRGELLLQTDHVMISPRTSAKIFSLGIAIKF